MLHISLLELARGGAQDVLARDRRPRNDERHDILQLIPKAVSTARLIKRRPCPHAAGQRLIEQPTVDQDVHGAIGGLYLYGTQRLIPEISHLLERGVEIESPVAFDERNGRSGRRLLAEQQGEFG